jgi:hypothetical protein
MQCNATQRNATQRNVIWSKRKVKRITKINYGCVEGTYCYCTTEMKMETEVQTKKNECETSYLAI